MKLIGYPLSMVLIIYTKNASNLINGTEIWFRKDKKKRTNRRTDRGSQNYIPPTMSGVNYILGFTVVIGLLLHASCLVISAKNSVCVGGGGGGEGAYLNFITPSRTKS